MKFPKPALSLGAVMALFLTGCASSESENKQDVGIVPMIKASAQLSDASGEKRGTAVLTENGDGLKLEVRAEGLASGTYGIHLHMVGRCEGPKYESAGSHWNPSSKQHGLENPNGSHEGDLPNIQAVTGKPTTYSVVIKGATLSSGSLAVLDADGTAIVIHAKPDDYKTDPSGNSGDRVICGTFSAD